MQYQYQICFYFIFDTSSLCGNIKSYIHQHRSICCFFLLIVIALTSSIAYGPNVYYDDETITARHLNKNKIMVPKDWTSFYIKQYSIVLINLSFIRLLPVTHCLHL